MSLLGAYRRSQAGRYAKASYKLARREAIANQWARMEEHRARERQRLYMRAVLIRRRNELLAELAAQTPPRPDLEARRALEEPGETPSIP